MKVIYDNHSTVLAVLNDGESFTKSGDRVFIKSGVIVCCNGFNVDHKANVPADYVTTKYFYNGKVWMLNPDFSEQQLFQIGA